MNEQTAWQTGLLLGHFMKHGIEAKPILDEAGNYSASVEITLPLPSPSGEDGAWTQKIIVTVEPPT